jgi:hypothetical protein
MAAHAFSSLLRGWDAYGAWVRQGLSWLSRHTGIPAIVIAAILVVVAYRVAKRSLKFVLQVSVVLIALATLAHLGLLRF